MVRPGQPRNLLPALLRPLLRQRKARIPGCVADLCSGNPPGLRAASLLTRCVGLGRGVGQALAEGLGLGWGEGRGSGPIPLVPCVW